MQCPRQEVRIIVFSSALKFVFSLRMLGQKLGPSVAVPQSPSHAERGTPAVIMLEGLQWLSRETYSGSAAVVSTA